MLLEYAMKNKAFCLKNLIWSINDLEKYFQDQIQNQFQFTNFSPQNYITFFSCVFLGKYFFFELSAWKD